MIDAVRFQRQVSTSYKFLTLDSKEKTKCSKALWLPIIWYVIAASRGITHWLHPEGLFQWMQPVQSNVNYLEGTQIDRTVNIILICIGVLVLVRRKINWQEVIKSNKWVFLLFLYMALSIIWSDFKVVSVKRWVKSIGPIIMVLVVLTESDPLEAISTLLKRSYFLLIPLSFLFIKYFRHLGVYYSVDGSKEMWIGVTTHKNLLGQLAMTSGIYFLWEIMRKWGRKEVKLWENKDMLINITLLCMTLWLLKGSPTAKSKSSILVFIFGVSVLLWIHFMRKNLIYNKKNVGISIIFLAMVVLIINFYLESFRQESIFAISVYASDRDLTLTGRTELWSDILNIASDHPFKGVGYGSFWVGDLAHNLWDVYTFKPGQGHNGYVDVYVELGVIGLFFLAGVLINAAKHTMRMFDTNFEYGKLRLAFFSMILIHNVTESSFLRGRHNLWFLFLLVALNTPVFWNIITPQKKYCSPKKF